MAQITFAHKIVITFNFASATTVTVFDSEACAAALMLFGIAKNIFAGAYKPRMLLFRISTLLFIKCLRRICSCCYNVLCIVMNLMMRLNQNKHRKCNFTLKERCCVTYCLLCTPVFYKPTWYDTCGVPEISQASTCLSFNSAPYVFILFSCTKFTF